MELAKIIRKWHEEDQKTEYPLEGNVILLGVQSLKQFQNLMKVWADNVPVKKDGQAMSELRAHRARLARASTSQKNVLFLDLIVFLGRN